MISKYVMRTEELNQHVTGIKTDTLANRIGEMAKNKSIHFGR